jgi:hypothetical protein
MSRHTDPGFDPRIADWLETDPNLAPPDVMRTVESAIPSIPQRRVVRLPWRSLPMNRLVILGASVALLAVLGLGAWTVGSRPQAPAVTPAPSAPAAVEASPDQAPPGDATLESYRAARDAICAAGARAIQPLRPRYGLLYDAAATDAQRADAVVALGEVVGLADRLAGELSALAVPPELVADHAANLAHSSDVTSLIREELVLLNAGKNAEALAVDKATDRISRKVEAFEQKYGLAACP